ncbi:hypothetical protein [Patulibacter sp. SYSU D01012]|uniref:hypothetical protein n=1 Tax=Patulibacter sp. SYSU D01012 TaxID=2817381 RepID=UPI001B300EA7|nr:hypothetical protein [Patulibacter sp. SYSU D01012]
MGARIRTPVITVAGAILLLALLSLIAPSTATYDPWAWIVWGREVVHGDLNTVDGPSWKPLPVVVTALAAPLGSVAPDVWIVVARAGALAAGVSAFLVGRRVAGPVAGVLAAVPLLLAPWFFWHGWLANSEGLLVAIVLGAIAAELDGRRRLALALGIAAGLLRPEAWPFVGLYAAWLFWRATPRGRVGIVAAMAVLPLAWLLPEKWGSGDYWRAATRAQNPDPGAVSLTARPWLTLLRNFTEMIPLSAWVVLVATALLAVAVAVRARRGAGAPPRAASLSADARTARPDPLVATAVIAAFGLAWFLLVLVMTERGFSGNERYLIQPVALIVVAIACAAGLVLRELPRPVTAVALGAFAVLVVVTAVSELPKQVRRVTYEAHLVDELPDAIAAAGGAARLRACAPVRTLNLMVPQVAWQLRTHASDVSAVVKGTPQPREAVLFRLRLTQGDSLRPSLAAIAPRRRVLARTPHWQIEATCRPTTGAR